MKEIVDLNRLEFLILDTLHSCGCEDKFHGMTITELMEENNGALGARMTVYKKMKKLVSKGYIQKQGKHALGWLGLNQIKPYF